MMELKVKKMRDTAILPTFGSAEAAGVDLYACIAGVKSFTVIDGRGRKKEEKLNGLHAKKIWISPGETVLIPSGIACDFPDGYFGQMVPRSSVGTKRGLTFANTLGVIDFDYKGEMFMAFKNVGEKSQLIEHGERLAQLILLPYIHYNIVETDELSTTERGEGGFGSTGK